MVSRQKDIKSFYKHLKKRYSDSKNAFPCDGALLNVLVYALFLENGTFEYADDAYEKISYYFIDWNEIRVSKGKEIAEVVDGSLRAELDGERLRRILQYIFDKTYEFKLEGVCKSADEFDAFMEELPYSTRFIERYVDYFVFGRKEIPLNEGALQILRRLNLVEVQDGKEVVPSAASKLSDSERTEFFTLIHRLGLEMASEESKDSALKFLALFDKAALKNSDAPLVEPRWSSDPREIAKALSKKEKEKNFKGSHRYSPAPLDEVAAEYAQDASELEDESYSENDEEDSGVETSVTLTSFGVTVDSPKTSRSRAGSESASAKSRKTRESALVENDFSTVPDATEKDALVEEPTEKKRAKKSSRAKDASEKKGAETSSDVEKVVEDKPAVKPSKKAKVDATRNDAKEDESNSVVKPKKASAKKAEKVAAEPEVDSSDADEKRASAKKSSSKKSVKKSDAEAESAKASVDVAPETVAKPAKKSSRAKKDAGEVDASVSKNVEPSADVKDAATSSAKRRKSTTTVKRSEPPDAESEAADSEKESASKAKAKASAKKKSADPKVDAKAVDAAPAKSSRTKSASKSKSGEATKIKEIQHKKPR